MTKRIAQLGAALALVVTVGVGGAAAGQAVSADAPHGHAVLSHITDTYP